MNGFEYIGEGVGATLAGVGRVFMLLLDVFKATPRTVRKGYLVVEQMMVIGVGSVPLIAVTSIFTGAVSSVQAAYQFQNYIPLKYLGTVIGKSVVIELGPVLTALVVGGRVGAAIAAELGTMKVTEQVDALETLAIDPLEYLVAPRFLAAIIMLPVITVFADFLAIMGGFVVANAGLGLSAHTYFNGLKMFFHAGDVFSGLIKAVFFGGIIATMGCYHGLRARGGAEGVGIATMKAVVSSCLLILITDYILAAVLFRGVFMG